MTNPYLENFERVTRRQLFGSTAGGVGLAALASLLKTTTSDSAESLAGAGSAKGGLPGLPHHPPRAKRVVVLWQGGGPSHVDLFDDKP